MRLIRSYSRKFSQNTAVYRGTYAQTLGPRLEIKAEIRALKILGADMVGMTHARECVIANELGMKIASIGGCKLCVWNKSDNSKCRRNNSKKPTSFRKKLQWF